MPNTLAHIGVQTFLNKSVHPASDCKWIVLGCIIPDIPWILQKIIVASGINADLIYVKLYTICQSSLFFSLLLAGTIALLTKDSLKIFILLAANSLIHLLLDACQTKWANGVHILAPFSWQPLHLNLFWPEQPITHIITFSGIIAVVLFFEKDSSQTVYLQIDKLKTTLSGLLIVCYFTTPFLFFPEITAANNHFIKTLQSSERSGKYVEMDRRRCKRKDNSIQTFYKEWFKTTNFICPKSEIASIQGNFIDNNTIKVSNSHSHSRLRNVYSVIGLSIILIIWTSALLKRKIYCKKTQ